MASSSTSSLRVETVNGIAIVRKKNTKSNVWLYFGLRATDDGDVIEEEQYQPICRKCGTPVRAKDSNTSNLKQHLHDHHPELLVNIPESSSSSARESRTMTQPRS